MCSYKQFQIPLSKSKCRIPQGSVLGPLPFILYVNDIADNLLSLTRLFADDTFLSYSSQSPYTIEDVINSDLESISIWSKQWLVNFNPQKTKAMVFSNRSCLLCKLTASQLVAIATRSDTGSHNRLDLIQSLVPPHYVYNGYLSWR